VKVPRRESLARGPDFLYLDLSPVDGEREKQFAAPNPAANLESFPSFCPLTQPGTSLSSLSILQTSIHALVCVVVLEIRAMIDLTNTVLFSSVCFAKRTRAQETHL